MIRVLIIEDDLNIAELERDYLQLNGYHVEIETDGTAGLAKAVSGRFDIVVVDLMLPRTDGFEILRAIRRDHEIPVVVVSAKTEDIDKIRGLDLGADDYLTKPFSPAEFVARIKSHLKRYQRLRGDAEGQGVILHRGLEINTASRQVTVNGREVMLTAKEYDLLVFLATHPNVVFTKDRLLDAVWGNGYFGDTATVAVHVQKIRKKIEADPAAPVYIETIWGAGYRFNS
ncbi:response regulator transcription factor [Geomesophilobacter sediminis]|uniref:Phosphate regulon transcriptional regulatory protein PhoB n=1 Tax=Geomesophilobacter sediminis TaxID=2798584 RepID=A0A8J7M1G3_9BACT|nr:response regulator transcription factor [Geomesophilobacter sediminis]MBJ6726708.1 response regulator transcription factor [Geomesophilobacter sediminis]